MVPPRSESRAKILATLQALKLTGDRIQNSESRIQKAASR
jgi:hypothetical protein